MLFTDKEHVAWSGMLQKLAHEIVVRVEGMIEKHPVEWQGEETLPEGCNASGWLQISQGGDGGDGGVAEADKRSSFEQAYKARCRAVAQAFATSCLKQACKARWRVTLEPTVQRALVRTLRRQPTQRVDIYDQFLGLWLDREIQKVMGQRGATSTPQLRLEVRALFVFRHECDTINS